MKPDQLGKYGEDLAAAYLQTQGYRIVKRNYRFRKAEIDILAFKDQLLVVVEVKTRNSKDFGDPQSFVRKAQVQLLVQAADHYLQEQQLDAEVRFDIIAVIKNKHEQKIEHLEDAFYHF